MLPTKVGPWRVLEQLGKGEFSAVCKGQLESDETGKLWALKLSPLVESSTDKKKKETKEQTCCRLLYWESEVYRNYANNHALFPTRPLRHALVDSDGWRLLAIELQPGGTLKDKVENVIPSVAATGSVGLRILLGLQHLHLRSWFVYKDIKPENVMLRDDDRGVCLVDFGLAQRFVDPKRQHFPAGGTSVGTPLFMSRGVHMQSPSSRRDDLESIGYLMWWMLKAGKLPWQHMKSEQEILRSKLAAAVPEELVGYFAHVTQLQVEDLPDYALLQRELENMGGTASGRIDWDSGGDEVTAVLHAAIDLIVETAAVPKRKRVKLTKEKASPPSSPIMRRIQPSRRVKQQPKS